MIQDGSILKYSTIKSLMNINKNIKTIDNENELFYKDKSEMVKSVKLYLYYMKIFYESMNSSYFNMNNREIRTVYSPLNRSSSYRNTRQAANFLIYRE